MLTSGDLKAALLARLRYQKQCAWVATECGSWNADVIGSDGKTLTEYEVKVSMSDFRREVLHKNHKHAAYNGTPGVYTGHQGWVPNTFHFAVPTKIAEAVQKEMSAFSPSYGLVAFDPDPDSRASRYRFYERLTTVKRAKPLHDRPVKARVLNEIVLRMGSDLCHFHLGQAYQADHLDALRDMSAKILQDAQAHPITLGVIEADEPTK